MQDLARAPTGSVADVFIFCCLSTCRCGRLLAAVTINVITSIHKKYSLYYFRCLVKIMHYYGNADLISTVRRLRAK